MLPAGGFSGALEEELDAPRWGHKQQSFPPPPRAAAAAPPVAAAEPAGQPVERKRLVLAPRSKPLQEDAAATAAAEPSPQSAEKSKKVRPYCQLATIAARKSRQACHGAVMSCCLCTKFDRLSS